MLHNGGADDHQTAPRSGRPTRRRRGDGRVGGAAGGLPVGHRAASVRAVEGVRRRRRRGGAGGGRRASRRCGGPTCAASTTDRAPEIDLRLAAARPGPAPARSPARPGGGRSPGWRPRWPGPRSLDAADPAAAGVGRLRHRRLRRPLQRPPGRGARPAAVRRDPRRGLGVRRVDAGPPRPVPRPRRPRSVDGADVGGGRLLPAGPSAGCPGRGGAVVGGALRGPRVGAAVAGAGGRDPGDEEGVQPHDPGLGGPAGLPRPVWRRACSGPS